MRKTVLVAFLGALMPMGSAVYAEGGALKSENDKISYTVGYQLGGDFKRQNVEMNADLVVKGIQDAMAGTTPPITPEEMNATMTALGQRVAAERRAAQQQQAVENLKEGEAFLAGNAKKEGVKTLPSGLQYKVIKAGSGKTPTINDTVTVHYRGTLINGQEFDSSFGRGKPATFGVGQVIKGWTEALQLMKEGDQWQLYIPPKLAYGERGAGSRIGPNSTLIFDVELIEVK